MKVESREWEPHGGQETMSHRKEVRCFVIGTGVQCVVGPAHGLTAAEAVVDLVHEVELALTLDVVLDLCVSAAPEAFDFVLLFHGEPVARLACAHAL